MRRFTNTFTTAFEFTRAAGSGYLGDTAIIEGRVVGADTHSQTQHGTATGVLRK